MKWRVTIEAERQLEDAIDICFTWVVDVQDSTKDVELEELEVGPFPIGSHTVELECDAPEADDLNFDTILHPTCIAVTFKYRGNEFLHVGVPVRVHWTDPKHEEEIPEEIALDLLSRELLNKTYKNAKDIDWGDAEAAQNVPLESSEDGDSSEEESTSADDEDGEAEAAQPASVTPGSKRGRDSAEVDAGSQQPPRSQPKAT
jgi:hypothetical protein